MRKSVSEPFREKGHCWEAFSARRSGRTGEAVGNEVLTDGKPVSK
ncbi:hypothetical protein DSBG_4093 [Desulfosporosinus sp. BG]|nr:hypothetical protein DSBG_4093 [Desulfosporosinus sp. BG]